VWRGRDPARKLDHTRPRVLDERLARLTDHSSPGEHGRGPPRSHPPGRAILPAHAASAGQEVRINVESELDRLYALEPGAFVAERDRLARELRDAGLREESEQVKGLRKPTVSAATINQLTRQERREVDLLLDAGHRLREAQQRLLAGEEPGSLDEPRRTEREALGNLRRAAARILDEAGRKSDATLNRIVETLQAAAVSTEGRELLARGRLTADLEATGFDLLAPLAEGAAPSRRRTSRKQATPKKPAAPRRKSRSAERVKEAREQLREARARSTAAEKALRSAERETNKARRELAQVEQRADKARAAAREARLAVESAERKLREAEGKRRA